ncbi:MAG: hypothetical protein ACK48I_17885, partial [Bacteroidota bacterium]
NWLPVYLIYLPIFTLLLQLTIAKPNLYFGINSHNAPTGTNPSPTRPKTCIIVEIGTAHRS